MGEANAGDGPSVGALVVAHTMAVDAWTVEALDALGDRGIPAMLLKGPAIADRLYPGDVRPYGDVDLLVPAGDLDAVGECLRGLGYRPARNLVQPDPLPADWIVHSRPWHRDADGATVDVHDSLFGVATVPGATWGALRRHTRAVTVLQRPVPAPDDAGMALVVALHAAAHRGEFDRPQEDLRRALRTLDRSAWEQAARLAALLNATRAFGTGLRLVPEGEALADGLGIAPAAVLGAAARTGGGAVVLGIERLAHAAGWRERLQILAREAFPAPAFLRWWRPWTARGPAWLALGYAYRLAWLLAHALPGIQVWLRARRAARRR